MFLLSWRQPGKIRGMINMDWVVRAQNYFTMRRGETDFASDCNNELVLRASQDASCFFLEPFRIWPSHLDDV
jgi:hypothetical protein